MSDLVVQSPSSTTPRKINPFASYDPISAQVSNSRWSKLWAVAALITAVSFTAFAATAIAFTTAYWAVHLPIVSIVIFVVGLPSSFRLFKMLWDKSENYFQEAKVDAQLIKRMPNIPDDRDHKGQIDTASGLRVEQVKQLRARISYFTDLHKEMLEKAEIIFSKEVELRVKSKIYRIDPSKYTVENTDFSKSTEKAIFHVLQMKRAESSALRAEAALCLLKAGYLLKVLQNTFEQRDHAKFIQNLPVSYAQRLVASDHGDTTSHILVKVPEKRNYTTQDLLSKTPTQLGKEVFELETSWF